jgi:succinyl-diaminopimelate desuccinylase
MPPANDLLELTKQLISIPSPSRGEETLAGWVEERMRGLAGETVRIANSVVHRGPVQAGRPLVVLAGHLDTVAPQGNAEPEVRGENLFGLGSSDMKSGLAVMLALAATETVCNSRFDLAWVFYDCEEIEFEHNGLRRLWDEIGWLAEVDLAFLLEPTACAVELGCLGSVHAEFTAPGRAAHSARPWMGENAVYRAIPFLQQMSERAPVDIETGGVTYRETVQVTRALAGGGRNVVPPAFVMNVNFRYAPVRTPDEAVAEVRSWAPEGFAVEIVDVSPPAPPRSEHPLIREFLEHSGCEIRAKQAWTDVAQFAGRGVPAMNFGPGIPELAHRADESLPIANLDRAHKTLGRFLSGGRS